MRLGREAGALQTLGFIGSIITPNIRDDVARFSCGPPAAAANNFEAGVEASNLALSWASC